MFDDMYNKKKKKKHPPHTHRRYIFVDLLHTTFFSPLRLLHAAKNQRNQIFKWPKDLRLCAAADEDKITLVFSFPSPLPHIITRRLTDKNEKSEDEKNLPKLRV